VLSVITVARGDLHDRMPTVPMHSAEYFFNAVLIMVAIGTLVIAVVAVAATVFGYRVVRSYVASEFIQRADAAFQEHGQPKIDAAIAESRAQLAAKLGEVDELLAKEIEDFRAAGGTG
jgi:hypothetical protein